MVSLVSKCMQPLEQVSMSLRNNRASVKYLVSIDTMLPDSMVPMMPKESMTLVVDVRIC